MLLGEDGVLSPVFGGKAASEVSTGSGGESVMSKLLLITGSRCVSQRELAYARRVVERAKQAGYSIIVGDAVGVDNVVMRECDKLSIHALL